MNRKAALLAAIATVAIAGQAYAATWVPTVAGTSYNWNVNSTTNWDTGTFPNGIGAEANVNINIAGAQTIRLQTPITVGTLNLGDSDGLSAFTISSGTGTNVLTLQNSGSTPAALNMRSTGTTGSTISAGVFLGSDLNWNAGTQGLTTSTNTFDTNGKNINIIGGVSGNSVWNIGSSGVGNLTGAGTITVSAAGGISVSGTKSFTGTLVLNSGYSGTSNGGTLILTSGSVKNAAEIVINGYVTNGVTQNGAVLHAGNSSAQATNPGQRIGKNKITLNGGSLEPVGQTATTSTWNSEYVSEDIATLRFNSGYSLLVTGASATTAGTRLNVATLERGVGASGYLRSTTLGATSRVLVTNLGSDPLDNSGMLKGAGGAAGTTTMSILPWLGVNSTTSGTSFPTNFAVYENGIGIRALSLSTTESATAITAGTTANVNWVGPSELTANTTVNSLRMGDVSAVQNIGAGKTLTISSGGLFLAASNCGLGKNNDTAAGTVKFGAEGVIWALGSQSIGAVIDGSNGITKAGTGTLTITGNNIYTGQTTVGGGTLVVGDGAGKGNLGGSLIVEVASGNTLSLLNSGNVSIADGAKIILDDYGVFDGKLNLAAGVNESVSQLYFGSLAAATGTWGATGSGATNIDDAHFSGSGMLNVVPEPATIALFGLSAFALLPRRARRSK